MTVCSFEVERNSIVTVLASLSLYCRNPGTSPVAMYQ
jgi:hypothetical protein